MNKKNLEKRKETFVQLFLQTFPEYGLIQYNENTEADEKNLFFRFSHEFYPIYVEDLYEQKLIIAFFFDKQLKDISVLEDKSGSELVDQLKNYIKKEKYKIKINKIK